MNTTSTPTNGHAKRPRGRPATGHVDYVPAGEGEQFGHYRIRVTAADRSRPWIDMDPSPRHSPKWESEIGTAKTAELRAGNWGAVPRPGAKVGAAAGESVADWCKRWLANRVERGLRSVSSDRGRLKNHVLPLLEGKAMVAVTRADIEAVVEDLDRKARVGELSWKTGRNTWMVVSKMFRDACSSKTKALRVRDDNPAATVAAPDRGVVKQKAFLFPNEFLALVSCKQVPLPWRRLFTLATYTYTRAGELAALEWDDVDLVHGIIDIHRSLDRNTGLPKPTKTKETRRIPIEPALVPLLKAMHEESGGKGRLVWMPSEDEQAKKLRAYLTLANVKREGLHANDATRKNITFHDLRATGITWMAVRGDDPLKIMSRAGHSDFATTQLYVRAAESFRADFGTTFPPLPASLCKGTSGAENPKNIVRVSSEKTQPSETIDPQGGPEPLCSGGGSGHPITPARDRTIRAEGISRRPTSTRSARARSRTRETRRPGPSARPRSFERRPGPRRAS
jgi:integrase